MKSSIAIVVLALLVVGCGSAETKTVTVNDAAAPPKKTAPANDCRDAVRRDIAGTCKDNGIEYRVSTPRGAVTLDELRARVTDVEILDTISSPDWGSADARGQYVVVRVALTNRTNEPQDLSFGELARLTANDKLYSQDSDGADTLNDSFSNMALDDIQPGETIEGAFVFDVPAKAASIFADDRGALALLNFSDVLSDDVKQIGLARLGAGDVPD